MKKLVAIALICAVASSAMAAVTDWDDLSTKIWAKGAKSIVTGAFQAHPGLWMIDYVTWEAKPWTEMPGIYGHGFADSGSKWYVGGGGTDRYAALGDFNSEYTPLLGVYNPTPEGAASSLVTMIDCTTLPGFNSQYSIVDLEWANGELYYAARHSFNLTDPDNWDHTADAATGTDNIAFGKFVLDANGIPVAAIESEHLLVANRVNNRASILSGALAYNSERDQWAFHKGNVINLPNVAGNLHWITTDDLFSGEWDLLRRYGGTGVPGQSTYLAAGFWMGSIDETPYGFPAEVMVYGRMTVTGVTVSLFDRTTVTNVALTGDPGTMHGWGDFASVLIVPEPATLALLAIGGLGILARRRRNA